MCLFYFFPILIQLILIIYIGIIIENKSIINIKKAPIKPLENNETKPATSLAEQTKDEKARLESENERIKLRLKEFCNVVKPDYELYEKIAPKIDKTIINNNTNENKQQQVFTNVQTFVQPTDSSNQYKSSESIDSLTQRRITVKTTIKCFLTERKPQLSTESDEYKLADKKISYVDDEDNVSLYKIVDPIPLPKKTENNSKLPTNINQKINEPINQTCKYSKIIVFFFKILKKLFCF